MTEYRRQIIWNQFGASIDMLENAIVACPDEIWGDKPGFQEFWYIAFHTLFWLDFYLHGPPEGFEPPPPFGLEELDPAGLFPDRVYGRAEILEYLVHGRAKLREVLNNLSEERAAETIRHGTREMSFEEVLWYCARHVQHHAAQLNLLLRQQSNSAPRWVSKARDEL